MGTSPIDEAPTRHDAQTLAFTCEHEVLDPRRQGELVAPAPKGGKAKAIN